MIGWLCGRVLHYQDDGALVLDVAGVGYEVHVATSDRFTIDEPLELFVYTSVRADAIVLYGFKSYGDREFFELLLATPGVGPSRRWRRCAPCPPTSSPPPSRAAT